MKYLAGSFLLVLACSSSIVAQNVDDEATAIAVVNDLFAAMKTKDAEKWPEGHG